MNSRVDFCGAGGSTVGLVDAGYDAPGYDHWKVAVDTCIANGHEAYVLDLSTDDPPAPARPWLYWASPPCQPFSAAGDGGGEDDARDGIPWWLRILGRQLPEVAIMENVRGLTFEKHSGYLARVLRQVHDLGYRYEWRILNSADYGVPQTRERFSLIARRDGGPIVWPAVTHTEQAGMFTERWLSMADALGWDGHAYDLDYRQNAPGPDGPRAIHCDLTDRPSPTIGTQSANQWRVTERQAHGGSRTGDEPSLTITASLDNGNLRRWPHTRPATTVNGDQRISAPGHHDEHTSGSQQADAISVTIDELARLQDFPDGYTFTGTKTDKARQIGNAVPPTMARLLSAANRPMALEVSA